MRDEDISLILATPGADKYSPINDIAAQRKGDE